MSDGLRKRWTTNKVWVVDWKSFCTAPPYHFTHKGGNTDETQTRCFSAAAASSTFCTGLLFVVSDLWTSSSSRSVFVLLSNLSVFNLISYKMQWAIGSDGVQCNQPTVSSVERIEAEGTRGLSNIYLCSYVVLRLLVVVVFQILSELTPQILFFCDS